jgi:hypothetical protein
MVGKLIVVSVTAVLLSVEFYGLMQRRKSTIIETLANQERPKIERWYKQTKPGQPLKRHCPNSQENFVFVKQGWWLGGSPLKPDPTSGQISVTRIKPGWYTFNYVVYFPSAARYAWINHREYGFSVNLVRPEKAYLSVSPPPLDDENRRTAQIYCSTRR